LPITASVSITCSRSGVAEEPDRQDRPRRVMTGTVVDVVVVGTGGAGLTAALTAARLGLDVLVLEKSGQFGGSTARSGGGVWIPGNEVLAHDGVADDPASAAAYLAHIVGPDGDPALQEAFLRHGPEMLA